MRAVVLALFLAAAQARADGDVSARALPRKDASTAQAVSPTTPAHPAGTKLLLLRLSLRMDRIDQEYAGMNRDQRAEQLHGADDLLQQLHGRYLDPHQQNTLFKIEMRLRALHGELGKSP